MPRVNERGQAFMGVGDGPASIDGATIAEVGGGCQPLDVDHAIYQTRLPSGAYALEAFDLRTRQRQTIAGSTGANELAAGGGAWLARLAGRGLYGAIVDAQAATSLAGDDGRGAIGRDGTLAYVPVQRDGVPTVLVAADGRRWTLPGACYGLQVLGPGLAVWNGAGGTIAAVGRPAPATLPQAQACRVAIVAGRTWLVYWTDVAGLVAHPEGRLEEGRVLEPRPQAFHHDAVGVGAALVVAWSATAGEAPGDLRKVNALDLPIVDLRELGPDPVPAPHPVPAPVPAPPVTATIADDWGPRTGEAPLVVSARAILTGAARGVQWLKATPGGVWVPDGDVDHAAAPRHDYRFDLPGDYVIGLRAFGADGKVADETGRQRTLAVRARVVPPPPPGPTADAIPPPDRLPRRPSHLVGVCWPTPWPQEAGTPDHLHLRMLALLGATGLRVNAHHARPDVLEMLLKIAEAGLRPWPTIDVTVPASRAAAGAVLDRELPGVVDFCHQLGARMPWIDEVEVYNEPSGIGMLPPPEYARLCTAVGEAMRQANPACRVYVAIEHVNTQSGGANPHWSQLRPLLSEALYDGVAWHPYRRDVDGSHWGTRRAEFAMLRDQVPAGKRIVVTEFGFRHVNHDPEVVADMTARELAIERELGIGASFVYAMVGSGRAGDGDDFGIFIGGGAWTPRPTAYRLAQYTDVHKETQS